MNPTVSLLEYTGKGRPDEEWHAANILIFTKATRLNMSPDLFTNIQEQRHDDKLKELEYMATTIPSAWEMVDLTFIVEGVTRACAQQMTRTRNASYQMQSQRVVDFTGATIMNPCRPGTDQHQIFKELSESALKAYIDLTENGATREEARGILPMNTHCNLVAKYNLRSLVELIRARKSMRTQSEYGDVVRQMELAVLEVWPWAATFFRTKNEIAVELIEKIAEEAGIHTGTGVGWELAKAVDLIR